MDDKLFSEMMNYIVAALKERGYDPYAQLCGYLEEDEPAYITTHNNARQMIVTLDKKQVRRYVLQMKGDL